MNKTASISVLHVDDEPDFAELAADMLERENARFTVATATNASQGLERLAADDVDCIVSDYDMPGQSGIEFLEQVRDEYPDLPFILYTGKGSEEVASDAISAGVTDYLQKKSGTDQYAVLANRICNAVEGYRAHQARDRQHEAIQSAQEGISILNEDGKFIYVNEAYADLYGYDPAEMLGEHWELIYPDDEVAFARDEILPTVADQGYWHGETTGLRVDGSTFPEDHVVSQTDSNELVCTVRDLSDQRERETELRMRTRAMDEAPIGITISDPSQEDNPLVYVNDRFMEMTGYDREEVLGRNCRFLQGENTAEEPVDAMRDAIDAQEPVTVELRNYRNDGTEFWNQVTIAPVETDAGDVTNYVGFQEDITKRKERERDLERERNRLEALFEGIPEPAVTVALTDDGAILQDVNDAFEKTFGYDASEAIGADINDLIVPDDASMRSDAERIDERGKAGEQLTREVRRETSDGIRDFLFRSVPFEQNDENTQQFGVYIDITERKERAEVLSGLHDVTQAFMTAPDTQTVADRAVETARTILNQPINGLWLYDPDDDVLRPVAMTEDATELLGEQPTYTGGESLSWRAFTDGGIRVYDDVQTESERLRAETPIRSEIIVPLGEYGVMNIGATEPASFSDIDISLARILGKTVEAALGRAEREQQLRTQRAELQRQNKRLEEFASIVSHDLRSPLSVAEGNLELAQNTCESDYLAKAADAIDRSQALIDDLLALAREGDEVDKTEPVALAEVAESGWQTTETQQATLNADLSQVIEADRSRLQELFENLYRNAVEDGGDEVTVSVGAMDDGFYVADSGPGIPESDHEEVFEAGYSTSAEGTGFGLRIVEQIAEAHGWDITVTESEQSGARFEITGVDFVAE